ncbi:MAG: ABC transporter ATP-binding protein/permease [Clostridia bacterium]|nr:ABC transporter ATP-binding protein/permease [Clostridia bacterium]
MKLKSHGLKELIKVVKWVGIQIRPFIFSLVLILVIGVLLSVFSVSSAIVSKDLVDSAVEKDADKAIRAVIIFALLIIAQVALNAGDSVLTVSVSEKMSNNIRQKLFECLGKAEWMSFSRYHSDDVLTRMTSDIGVVANGIVSILPGMFSLGVRLVAAFATLIFFDPVLAVLAFVISPVSLIFYRYFGKKLKRLHLNIQEAEGRYRAFIHESIQNMLIVKTFCLEEQSSQQLGKLQSSRVGLVLRRNRLGVVSYSMLSIGYWIGYLLAFAWGAMRLFQGTATFGTLTAFFQLVGQIQTPFIGLARTFPQLVAAEASACRLMELEKLPRERGEETPLGWDRAGISIENLSFAYEDDKTVVKNVNFDIKPGEIVAVVGSSGEGKTTIIRLLLSLLKPANGKLFFYDENGEKAEASASNRTLVSYVPQGNTLFSGTISENLRLGNINATEKELTDALRTACAWEFVHDLKDGLDTKIGERGLGLSEGQAQRLSIARALLRKTPVLVLDEATSALDADTEMKVLNSIKRLSPARTCIIITHRPSALKICNRVMKLEDGCIFEHGEKLISDSASQSA